MKVKVFYISFFACFLIGWSCFAQFITLQGNQFKDENGKDFYPISVDYVAKLNYNVITQTYFMAPIWIYGDEDKDSECFNHTDCIGQIQTDFKNIKAMGFNAVLLVAGPQARKVGNNPPTYFVQIPDIDPTSTPYPGCCWWPPLEPPVTLIPVSSHPEIVELVNGIEEIIDYAKTIDLKIILDCGINHFETQQIRDVYFSYLDYIANRLKNKTNLLAWRINSEMPLNAISSGSAGQGRDKKYDVCKFTTDAYNVIKLIDPNHLISGIVLWWDNFMVWDPAVMKLDFFTPHMYDLHFQDYEDVGFSPPYHNPLAMDREYAMYYLWQNNSPLPWMVGEDCFVVPPDCKPSWSSWPSCTYDPGDISGDEIQQADYIQNVLSAARNAGGSGFNIWQYQDYAKNLEGAGGILRSGTWVESDIINDFANGTFNAIRPQDLKFKSFLDANGQPPPPVPMTQPANYYDPYHTDDYATQFQGGSPVNVVTGTVVDQNGNPIKDAIVMGYTNKEVIPDPNDPLNSFIPIDNFALTFTHADGSFSLTPFSVKILPAGYSFDISKQFIRDLKITAVGCSVQEYGSYGNFNPAIPIPTSIACTLQKRSLNLDETVNNQTVLFGQSKIFQAAHNLTVNTNNKVQPFAAADFKAYNHVDIQGEFHASIGSEVHIYNEITFPDCEELGPSDLNFRSSENPLPAANENIEKGNSIELVFRKKKNSETVAVLPTISSGKFTVLYSGASEVAKQIKVYDMLGKLLFTANFTGNETQIDLSTFGKGLYILKTYDESKTHNNKIIVQ